DKHKAIDVGDEPLMLSQYGPVYIGKNRFISAQSAYADLGEAIVLLDDGLQNYSLKKDLSIVVVDGSIGFGNLKVFPAGPLRMPLRKAFTDVHMVIIIGEDEYGVEQIIPPHIKIIKTKVIAQRIPLEIQNKAVMAFAGIAYPKKFFKTLESQGIVPKKFIEYPDHYQFNDADLHYLSLCLKDYNLITTEKDWVRLPVDMREKIYYLPINLEIH
ncbi:MAG: tetraacyldisaccharide 4'-kinase, partial [Bacteroidota bacterium]